MHDHCIIVVATCKLLIPVHHVAITHNSSFDTWISSFECIIELLGKADVCSLVFNSPALLGTGIIFIPQFNIFKSQTSLLSILQTRDGLFNRILQNIKNQLRSDLIGLAKVRIGLKLEFVIFIDQISNPRFESTCIRIRHEKSISLPIIKVADGSAGETQLRQINTANQIVNG